MLNGFISLMDKHLDWRQCCESKYSQNKQGFIDTCRSLLSVKDKQCCVLIVWCAARSQLK